MKYYSAIAEETLKNRTVCVKDGDSIRNIIDLNDVEEKLLVFVNNVEGAFIDINKSVRYAVVNLSFRG